MIRVVVYGGPFLGPSFLETPISILASGTSLRKNDVSGASGFCLAPNFARLFRCAAALTGAMILSMYIDMCVSMNIWRIRVSLLLAEHEAPRHPNSAG